MKKMPKDATHKGQKCLAKGSGEIKRMQSVNRKCVGGPQNKRNKLLLSRNRQGGPRWGLTIKIIGGWVRLSTGPARDGEILSPVITISEAAIELCENEARNSIIETAETIRRALFWPGLAEIVIFVAFRAHSSISLLAARRNAEPHYPPSLPSPSLPSPAASHQSSKTPLKPLNLSIPGGTATVICTIMAL